MLYVLTKQWNLNCRYYYQLKE